MSFDVAAEAYDSYMGLWAMSLSPQMADLAGVVAGQRVLDVGCGPGQLTAELVARVGAARVAAVDPSKTFTAAAQARHPGVDVIVASAEALPFPADEFDAALAQLVVHFMADPVVGIREMARVTVPGGAVAACVWDFAGGRGPLGPFWEAAAEIDPEVENESWLAGARRGHLAELFEFAGLTELESADLVAIREYPGFDAWWDPFTRGVGPGGAYVGRLDPHRREELRNRLRSMLPEGSFVLTAHAWAARGRVGHG